MKKSKKLFLIIISFIIMLQIHTVSLADVGSFDRYDSGSSSSSSSSWDSGSSSSWSSHDYDYGSSSSSSYDSDSDLDGFTIIGVLVFFAIVFIYSYIKAKNSQKSQGNISKTSYTTPEVDISQSHIWADEIKKIDPNFSEEKMLAWAKDLYVKLQNAWTARDWEPMRPFETESLFEQHKSQLQGYIDTNRINIVDRIAVNYATLYKFRQEGDRDIIEIALKATKKDYIIDATTKEVLEGNKEQDRISVYKMTFERKTGVLTPEGTGKVKTTNCPNCGAPTEITSAGKCPYCGSVITTGNNTWVLSGLEPLNR